MVLLRACMQHGTRPGDLSSAPPIDLRRSRQCSYTAILASHIRTELLLLTPRQASASAIIQLGTIRSCKIPILTALLTALDRGASNRFANMSAATPQLPSNPAEDQGPELKRLTIAMCVIATLFIAVRLNVRAFVVKAIGWDDYVMLASGAMVCWQQDQRRSEVTDISSEYCCDDNCDQSSGQWPG
jgi:hypothetical protein